MSTTEITKELFISLEKRIDQYCLAAFNRTPEHYYFTEGGLTIVTNPGYQYADDEYHYVTAEQLTGDLEELANIRLEEERIAREKAEIARQEQKARADEYAKTKRYLDYLQLKREFEQP